MGSTSALIAKRRSTTRSVMTVGRSKMALASGEPPVTLSHWEKWRSDAGVRGRKVLKATSGTERRYVWHLDGAGRFCDTCGMDIVRGEQSVHYMPPWIGDEEGCWHPRCITPGFWRKLLGQPRAGRARSSPAPKVNDDTIRQAESNGGLTLLPGVTVEMAVDRLRDLRGQKPLKRATSG